MGVTHKTTHFAGNGPWENSQLLPKGAFETGKRLLPWEKGFILMNLWLLIENTSHRAVGLCYTDSSGSCIKH